MARVTHPVRGIGIMSRAWLYPNLRPQDGSATGSTYTETGREPGIAVAGQSGALAVPIVSLAQGQDMEFVTVKAGSSGGMAYRFGGETDASYRGMNDPKQVVAAGAVRFDSGGEDYSTFCAALDPMSQRVMVVSSNANDNSVSLLWSPATRAWTVGGTVDTDTINTPAMFYFADTQTWVVWEIKAAGISMAWYSRDDGTSWDLYSEAIFDTQPRGTAPATVVMDPHGNLVLCTGARTDGSGTVDGELDLYRSEDRGASWTRYHTSDDEHGSAQIAAFSDGSIALLYVDPSDTRLKIKILADSYTDPDGVVAVNVSAGNGVEVPPVAVPLGGPAYPATLMITHDDVLYVYFVSGFEQEMIQQSWSADRGVTFTDADDYLISLANDGGDDPWMDRLLAIPTGGEALLFHIGGGSTSIKAQNTEKSLSYALLGGWTNLEFGGASGDTSRSDRRSFSKDLSTAALGMFAPGWVDPEEVGFTLVSGGVPSTIFVEDGIRIDTTTQNGHYTTSYTDTNDNAVLTWQLTVEAGGSQTGQNVIVYSNRRDGTNETEVEIRYDTAGFRLHDLKAGTDIATVALDMTTPTQFALIYNTNVSALLVYKRPGDTLWLVAGVTSTLQVAATAATASTFLFGHFSISISTSVWGPRGYATRMVAHAGLASSPVTTKLRWGAELSGRPCPTRDSGVTNTSDRTHLAITGGPLHLGRTFTVEAAGKDRVEHLFPITEPSPSITWVGTDQSEAIFTVDLGSDGRPGVSWVPMLYVEGAGFREAILSASTNADPGTFVELGTLDLGSGFTGLSYVASGRLLRPAAGVAGTRYVAPGELRGGYVVTAAGAAGRIHSNSGGYWSTTAGVQQLEIELEDATISAGSTITLVWPKGLLTVPLDGATGYRYWRVALQSGTTPEGALSCGSMWFGSLLVPGRQWGRGTLHELTPNRDLRSDSYGSARVEEIGPALQRLTVGWPDGVDHCALRVQDGGGFLSAGASTYPLATYNDVRGPLHELVRESQSGRLPLVALLAELGETAETITDPSLFHSGWFDGTIGTEHIQGEEGSGEVFRHQTINIEPRI